MCDDTAYCMQDIVKWRNEVTGFVYVAWEVAWRSGRVLDSHAGGPGSIPGRGNPKPPRVDQAFHPSVVDKIGT